MGSGNGQKIDLPLIMKIVALICCAVALGLTVSSTSGNSRSTHVSNTLIYSTGCYIVILGFCFLWSLIKDPVDKKFLAILLICGCIWTIGTGIGVICYYVDYKHTTHDYQLIGGVLTLAVGIVMLIDALHNFGVF